jgi:hypothetical protein
MRGVGEKNRRQRGSAGAVNNVYATARNLTGLSKSRQAHKSVTSLSLTVITITITQRASSEYDGWSDGLR